MTYSTVLPDRSISAAAGVVAATAAAAIKPNIARRLIQVVLDIAVSPSFDNLLGLRGYASLRFHSTPGIPVSQFELYGLTDQACTKLSSEVGHMPIAIIEDTKALAHRRPPVARSGASGGNPL